VGAFHTLCTWPREISHTPTPEAFTQAVHRAATKRNDAVIKPTHRPADPRGYPSAFRSNASRPPRSGGCGQRTIIAGGQQGWPLGAEASTQFISDRILIADTGSVSRRDLHVNDD